MQPRKHLAFAALFTLAIAGCETTQRAASSLGDLGSSVPRNMPQAFAGYVPLDPLPVLVLDEQRAPDQPALTPEERNRARLAMLPDETVRIAVSDSQGNFGLTYGVASVKAKNSTYIVVLDYMKFTTTILTGNPERGFTNPATRQPDEIVFESGPAPMHSQFGEGKVQGVPEPTHSSGQCTPAESEQKVVPVYTGIGLRITAEVTLADGDVNLGSLFAIGAAAEAKKLRGSLIVQSMGIGGPEISAAIPMPSEINQTTIANAIMALATIKSKIHSAGTTIEPRVLGIYDMTGQGQATKNMVITRLLQEPPELPRKFLVRTPGGTFEHPIVNNRHDPDDVPSVPKVRV
jgi:hypothetical protein